MRPLSQFACACGLLCVCVCYTIYCTRFLFNCTNNVRIICDDDNKMKPNRFENRFTNSKVIKLGLLFANNLYYLLYGNKPKQKWVIYLIRQRKGWIWLRSRFVIILIVGFVSIIELNDRKIFAFVIATNHKFTIITMPWMTEFVFQQKESFNSIA